MSEGGGLLAQVTAPKTGAILGHPARPPRIYDLLLGRAGERARATHVDSSWLVPDFISTAKRQNQL